MAVISERKKFIFIHIRKTAGSSIRSSLHRNIPEKYLLKVSNRALRRLGFREIKKPNPLPNHATALDYAHYLGERYDEFFTFAFSRHPYDWHVSYFHYLTEAESEPLHPMVRNMDFLEYIQWRCGEGLELQSDWVTNENGDLMVDFLGKVENISDDFEFLKRKLNLIGRLPKKNTSSHKNYQHYFNEETAQLVRDFYAKDFDLFGYEK